MAKGISQKTGDAPIVQQGHTANSKHGSGPDNRAVSRPEPRDLTRG